ncbi:MAG: cysteine peptidase family C39 domain-containing protein [Bacilli bacterium]|nr:cysteine peptidase family C39 domain-containing protein [Bacilli bacterium]
MSKYFCYQGSEHDCGFASLKMLLATINKNKSFLRLNSPFKDRPYSFSNLIEIASRYNVKLCAFKYIDKDLSKINIPALVLINSNHLVLVKKITTKFILVNDPSLGSIKIKIDKFLNSWSGETLEIAEYKRKELKIKNKNILSPISQIISLSLSILGVASLVTGLYFIKGDSFILTPFILLTIFMIFELVEKWYLIKEIKFFDNKYIPLFFSSNNISKNDYKFYASFKSKYFSYSRKLFSSLILTIIIVVSLILNDSKNCIAFLILLLVCVIEKIMFHKGDCKIKDDISINEQALCSSARSNLVEDIKSVCNKSSSFALKIALRKCINTFIVIIISFLLMLSAKEISVNYVIFHFGLYYVLLMNFDVFLNADWEISDYKKDKAKFIHKCNL